MTDAILLLLLAGFFPGWIAQIWVRVEAKLPGARDELRQEEIRKRAKRIRRIRNRKFCDMDTQDNGGPL